VCTAIHCRKHCRPTYLGWLVPPLLVAPMVLLVLIGLRDKTIFLAARGEQYFPALFFFAVLPFTDMIIALKMLIVLVWVGAGFSKFGKHFANVIPPMVSTQYSLPNGCGRAHYRDFPRNLRPSRLADFMAHVNGTTVEIAAPLVLFFSTNKWLTLAAVVVDGGFPPVHHLDVPLAVPAGMGTWSSPTPRSPVPWLPELERIRPVEHVAALAGSRHRRALLFFPVLGNLRPDKVSFLPSLRQYAGNWASAVWAFAPGAEAKLDRVTRSARNQVDQFIDFGYEPHWAEITAQRTIAWRTMHSQGRGLFSLLLTHLPDIDTRTVREGEFICNSLTGFNFGDGHPARCRHDPGRAARSRL